VLLTIFDLEFFLVLLYLSLSGILFILPWSSCSNLRIWIAVLSCITLQSY